MADHDHILLNTLHFGPTRVMLDELADISWPPPERIYMDGETFLLREAVGLDIDIERLLGEIDDGLISIVQADLEVGRRAGLVRDLDARVTATLMVGGVEKLALTALRSDEPVDLRALAYEAARLHGIGILSDDIVD